MTDTSNVTNVNNGHEFVDLGLPSGLLWATCNVGANSPEQTGLYFTWGETKGFTAEQIARGERKFLKKTYDAKEIKNNLSLEQDAAHVCMGGKWRMPTKGECQELTDYCRSEFVENYKESGVNGLLLTSCANGNSVFFPAVGYCDGSSVDYMGSYGGYWTASWKTSGGAWGFSFINPWSVYVDFYGRYYGLSVRGVCER